MKKIFFSSFVLFSMCVANNGNVALSSNPNWKNYLEHVQKKYNTYIKNKTNSFQNYQKLFYAYKKEIEQEWGKYAEVPSKTAFILYKKNIKEKIDFKNRKIILLIKAKNMNNLKKKVLLGFEDIEKLSINNAIRNNKLMHLLVKKTNNNFFITNKNQPIIGSKYIDFNKLKITKKDKNIYQIKLTIPKQYYLEKAKQLKPYVEKMSNKFDIPPYVIYTIIEIESAYNPLAISPVPAYGLMQIVPQTAGKDVLNTLYKKNYIPTPAILFNPKYNIFIGTGYLSKLYYAYFRNIKNPLSRLYITIAAYNTGPGNIAYTFVKNNNLQKAIKKINELSAEEVYLFLLKNLPYKETINYVKKAKEKIILYKNALDKNLI